MKFFPLYCLLAALFLAGCDDAQKPAPIVRYGVGQGAGSAGIHTVSSGETLWIVSKRYNIAARDIALANHLSPPFRLAAGQRLKLPPPQQYRVRPGDSLHDVSRLFGVGASEIARMNHLNAPYALADGQMLRLPSLTSQGDTSAIAMNPAPPVFTAAAPAPAVPVASDIAAEPLAPLPATLQVPQGRVMEAMPPAPMPRLPGSPPPWIASKLAARDRAPVPVEVEPPPSPTPQLAMAEPIPMAPPVHFTGGGSDMEPPAPKNADVPKRASSKFLVPVKGPVLSGYGPKDDGLYNDGINIQAARGTPVRAADNGIVVFTGDALKGSGNLVLIRHADRWMTAYAHMDGISVKRGDTVKRGQTIGTVGATGSVNAPQLHFEVRRGTEALNPQVYLEG